MPTEFEKRAQGRQEKPTIFAFGIAEAGADHRHYAMIEPLCEGDAPRFLLEIKSISTNVENACHDALEEIETLDVMQDRIIVEPGEARTVLERLEANTRAARRRRITVTSEPSPILGDDGKVVRSETRRTGERQNQDRAAYQCPAELEHSGAGGGLAVRMLCDAGSIRIRRPGSRGLRTL